MTTTSDVGVLQGRSVVLACISIILLIALCPVLTAGYAVPDDFQFALWANSPDKWNKAYITAQDTGRFELPPEFRLPRVTYNRSHHERGDDEDTEAAIHLRV